MPQKQNIQNLAIDKDLHQQLKAIANREQRRLQAIADRIIRAGLEAERKDPAHA